jgi:hypothetical protein
VLNERVLTLIAESPHPLSARELGEAAECDDRYQLRTVLFHLRRRGEVGAELRGDALVYSPLPPGEPPQTAGLTMQIKNGSAHKNGHKPKPNGTTNCLISSRRWPGRTRPSCS